MPDNFNLVFEHEIELTFADRDNEVYRARVDSVTDTSIVICTPSYQNKPLALAAETGVKVIYVDQLAIYSFTSVIKSVYGSPQDKFTIAIPENIDRTQRRNFVRVDVSLQMTFFTQNEDQISFETFNTKTRDLSGGGLRFDFDERLPLETTLDVLIDLPATGCVPAYGKVSVVGKVVRCLPIGSPARRKYSIGVEFVVVEKQDREAIIRYLFEHQRQLRKQGLL
ncbi:MAG TPA: PilZ domain-containing protein [Bacillota bacterium]|nr:PilZ domain-containing protein [Bacillota bacterium]